jgi:hypothetical protein
MDQVAAHASDTLVNYSCWLRVSSRDPDLFQTFNGVLASTMIADSCCRSYYKCTSARCGAKKHVEKSVDDPEVLVVTYEGPHLHGPHPPIPCRRWSSADFFLSEGPSSDANQLHTCDAPAVTRGVVAGELRDRQNGRAEDDVVTATRSCGGCSSASVAAPLDGTALPCDSPPTIWPCPDFYYSSWSPEALLL